MIAACWVAASNAEAAILVVQGGGPYDITSGDQQFFGAVTASGGAGTYSIDFTAPIDPTEATASATIGVIVSGTFTGLTMSWVDTFSNVVISSIAVGPIITELSTLFTAPNLNQTLVFAWTGSQAGAGFDFEIQAQVVPVPGALALFATGIVGLAMRRRRVFSSR